MIKKKKHMKRILEHMELINAPEGFTERVMNRVMAEPRHSKITYQPLIKPYVWIIICALLAVLIYFGILQPDPEKGTGDISGMVINLQPIYEWFGNVLVSFSNFINISVLLYLAFSLISIIIIDEIILKKIYHGKRGVS
jgi:hypothetical protein